MKNIGYKLRNMREERNISSKDFAEAIGVSTSKYSKIENNKLALGIDELRKVCDYYSVLADEILGTNNKGQSEVAYMIKDKKMSVEDIKEIEMIFSIMDEAITLSEMKGCL